MEGPWSTYWREQKPPEAGVYEKSARAGGVVFDTLHCTVLNLASYLWNRASIS